MSPTQSSARLRILLVEDDKHDRIAFHRAFRRIQHSCEITECERAEEALERLRADGSSFDLVVIDHGLPGISGLDLCKELLDEEVPLPLILLTGRGSEELAVEALKVGVNDYIIKDSGMGYLDLLPAVLPEVVRKHGDRVARERAESALRESEERFRNIVEGSEAGYCFIDQDARFKDERLKESELSGIDIEVSILSSLQRISNPLDFQLGRHGIYIKKGEHVGCLLPQVAEERGWSKEEFLSNCCTGKAGLGPGAWKEPGTEVYVFMAGVVSESA